jgi:hypothetical protein
MSRKQMKQWKQTLTRYVYNHCNICNTMIYFCNTHMKHLQHTSETSEIDNCNMHFQQTLAGGWVYGALHSGI